MRIKKLCGWAVALVACVIVSISPARASGTGAQDRVTESFTAGQVLGRGFDATTLYDFANIDSINTFNGNVSVGVPLGRTYSTTGGFSYRFTASYNSSAWDYRTVVKAENSAGDCGGCSCERQIAIPASDSNAGLGWKVSFAELYPPFARPNQWSANAPRENPNGSENSWLFAGPDGARTAFVRTLHPRIAPQADVFYSADGAYSRLLVAGNRGRARVETSDGTIYDFERYASCANEGQGAYRLRRIANRFDTAGDRASLESPLPAGLCGSNTDGQLFIDYPATPNEQQCQGGGRPAVESWAICDDTGRSHRVELVSDDRFGAWGSRIEKVELAGYDGAVLEHDFVYADHQVRKPAGHTADFAPWSATTTTLPLLERIDPPAANTAGTDASRNHTFDYFTLDDQSSADFELSGQIARVRLPTGGRIHYDYQRYAFPSLRACDSIQPANPCSRSRGFETHAVGIRARTVDDPIAGQANPTLQYGTWHYRNFAGFPDLDLTSASCTQASAETQRIVIDPFGHVRVDYYNVPVDNTGTNDTAEWGLPFTRESSVDFPGRAAEIDDLFVEGEKLALSSTLFEDCAVPLTGQSDPSLWGDWLPQQADSQGNYGWQALPDAKCASLRLRSQYVRHSVLARPASGQWPDYCHESPSTCAAFRLPTASATVNHDDVASGTPGDSGRRTQTAHEGFNGLGSFRTTHTGGDYWRYPRPESTPFRRTTTLDYVHGGNDVDAATASFSFPGPDQPWRIDGMTRITTSGKEGATEAWQTSVRELCLDPATDAVIGIRTRADLGSPNSRGAHDLLTLDTRDGAGRVVRTRYFGGDDQALPTGGGACDTSGSKAAYRKDFAYQGEVRIREEIVDDATNQVLLRTVDHVNLDANTGVVRASLDATGLRTEMSYDRLGRPIQLRPPGQAPRNYLYQTTNPDNPTTGTSARVIVTEGTVAPSKSWTLFDGFGRPFKQQKLHPAPAGDPSVKQVIKTEYRADGLVDRRFFPFRSDIGRDGYEVYRYDALGRLVLKKTFSEDGPAQPGGGHQLLFTNEIEYLGDREQIFRSDVVVDETGSVDTLSRRVHYDPLGNLNKVQENSGPGGAFDVTRYGFDIHDRMTWVFREAKSGDTAPNHRFLLYDGRGFQVAVDHPETTETHTCYDALGNPTRTWVKATTGLEAPDCGSPPSDALRHLRMGYDRAGRVLFGWDEKAGRLLSQYFYGTTSSPDDRATGKVVESRAYNYTDAVGTSIVSERFEYGGIGGRLSRKTLRATTGGLFELGFAYDELGRLDTLDYPECGADQARCATVPARTIRYDYRHGDLVQVTGDRRDASGTSTVFGYAPALRYHGSALQASVDFGDGTTWIQDEDPAGLPRPHRIRSLGADFDSGTYVYDASGHITAMGEDRFWYDLVGRLSGAKMEKPSGRSSHAGGSFETETYGYDSHGNLISIAGTAMAVDGATNRLVGETYDAFGNLTRLTSPGVELDYDSAGRIISMIGTGIHRNFLYDAGGERLATIDLMAGTETWTLRGPGNQVLRTVERSNAAPIPAWEHEWAWQKDHLYRGSVLLASIDEHAAGGDRASYFHLDHLGSPRLISRADDPDYLPKERKFLPFGRALEAITDSEVRRFTGHERDSMPDLELDYMHARYHAPHLGRFLSPDPVLGDPLRPQSWNRYAYAVNNPIGAIDPDGRTSISPTRILPHNLARDPAYQQAMDWVARSTGAGWTRDDWYELLEDVPMALVAAGSFTLPEKMAAPPLVVKTGVAIAGLGLGLFTGGKLDRAQARDGNTWGMQSISWDPDLLGPTFDTVLAEVSARLDRTRRQLRRAERRLERIRAMDPDAFFVHDGLLVEPTDYELFLAYEERQVGELKREVERLEGRLNTLQQYQGHTYHLVF